MGTHSILCSQLCITSELLPCHAHGSFTQVTSFCYQYIYKSDYLWGPEPPCYYVYRTKRLLGFLYRCFGTWHSLEQSLYLHCVTLKGTVQKHRPTWNPVLSDMLCFTSHADTDCSLHSTAYACMAQVKQDLQLNS